eukprot:m.93475 g.93475  ORF g.93475 m.93475 type:complete len:174 (-) comp12998_c0_seq1:136-657(-)
MAAECLLGGLLGLLGTGLLCASLLGTCLLACSGLLGTSLLGCSGLLGCGRLLSCGGFLLGCSGGLLGRSGLLSCGGGLLGCSGGLLWCGLLGNLKGLTDLNELFLLYGALQAKVDASNGALVTDEVADGNAADALAGTLNAEGLDSLEDKILDGHDDGRKGSEVGVVVENSLE